MKEGHSLPLKGGDEYDALTRFCKYLSWRAGERAKIKQRYWKRVRREAGYELGRELDKIIGRENGFNS